MLKILYVTTGLLASFLSSTVLTLCSLHYVPLLVTAWSQWPPFRPFSTQGLSVSCELLSVDYNRYRLYLLVLAIKPILYNSVCVSALFSLTTHGYRKGETPGFVAGNWLINLRTTVYMYAFDIASHHVFASFALREAKRRFSEAVMASSAIVRVLFVGVVISSLRDH